MASRAALNGTNSEAFQAIYPGENYTVSVSGTSARTATDFTSGVNVIQFHSKVDCFIKFGDSTVVATTSDTFLPADVTICYARTEAQTRVAAIQLSGAGSLYITEAATT